MNEINQIVSVLAKNSILPTRNDLVAKLPAQIEGMEKETLVEALSQIYRKAVESRGIEFQDITGKELGSEPERCQSYGTDYTPVQNLISYRYDRKLPTIVTTNLADDKILDRYGPRMMDRINEMFSILRFKGDSYRK